MTTPDLAVLIEARLNTFERQMKAAGMIADRNFTRMEKRSRQATDRIEGHMMGLAGKVAGVGKSLAAGFVGGLAGAGVMEILGRGGEIARGIAEIGDEAKRSGLGVEAFQELKYVAEQNRLGVDSLVDGIKELQLRADEFIVTGKGPAAEAFARLGYNAETLKVKLRDPSALFTEIIGKLGQLDRAAQIRIADEIFGGTGGERFVQLIEEGEDALNRTRQEARDLGLIMSDELIAKADELDRRFNAVASTVGTALKTAIVEAAAALGDFITTFNHFINGTMPDDGRAGLGGNQQWTDLLSPDERNRLRLDLQLAGVRGAGNLYEGFTFGDDGTIDVYEPPPPLPITVSGATPVGGGGGGRSAGSMREQRDAAAELIRELENELRMLGMSEVEQRINAELRRAGAGATDAQKAEIRELVMAIETESAAMDQLETAMNGAKGLAKDFLGGLIGDLRAGVDGATALANAFGRLADRLLDMALDGLINSLFSSFMGGGAGLLGGALGLKDGGVVEAATGGLIRGPGTSTSDSIPARLSDGEFVVNAAAARRNLDLLRAINDGTIAAFAAGGLVGGMPSQRAGNDNYRHANDNAPVVTINAPITVNGSAGTEAQNADLAKRMRREFEAGMRGLVAKEIMRQGRAGNTLNTRSR